MHWLLPHRNKRKVIYLMVYNVISFWEHLWGCTACHDLFCGIDREGEQLDSATRTNYHYSFLVLELCLSAGGYTQQYSGDEAAWRLGLWCAKFIFQTFVLFSQTCKLFSKYHFFFDYVELCFNKFFRSFKTHPHTFCQSDQ